MGDRELPFDPDAICGCCGRKGAFDVMGDYFCSICIADDLEDYDEDLNDEGNWEND